MKAHKLFLRLALLFVGVFVLTLPAAADAPADAPAPEAETGLYCFSREDLDARVDLDGVFLTELPVQGRARVLLGDRELRAGDAVPRSELCRLRLEPVSGGEAALCFLPVEDGHLGTETVLTFHLERTEDEAPVAQSGKLETWRNLPNNGTLRATDDGDGALTYRLVNQPRRGTVELRPDGSYTYTPKKNKVGEDSFTFTATDEAGHSSAPATVRVTIRKPTDAQTYADLDRDAQFTALWLRETGLFGGELISDRLSFGPEQTVSRGDFLAMLMDLEGIEPEVGLRTSGFADEAEAAAWLRPYLASALRRGLITGEQGPEGLVFRPNEPITAAEAAQLAARVADSETAVPAALLDAPESLLTRQQAADLLYQISEAD